MNKTCSKCKQNFDISHFYTDRSKSDNLTTSCKFCIKERNNEWNNKNREKRISYAKEYYANNRTQIIRGIYSWIENNKEHYLKKAKEYRDSHKKERREYFRKYDAIKREDISERIHDNFSRRIRNLLSKNGKETEQILNYTMGDLMKHLESRFDKHMNWGNYGSYWHIDHIIPVSHFSFASEKDSEFQECWSLNNLQPLEAGKNRRKSNKLLSESL